MCGFLFYLNTETQVDSKAFYKAFDSFSWRGPDSHNSISLNNGRAILAHHRLSIIEPSAIANQPMRLSDGETYIIFNGEVYNHIALRKELRLKCKTRSDTETIGEGYLKIGERIFEKLDGMFSIALYNSRTMSWIASRDAFGIKPLYIYAGANETILGSEPAAIESIIGSGVCDQSIAEWKILRRPIPGHTFFKGVSEILPGTIVKSDGTVTRHWDWESEETRFDQDEFESLLIESVQRHELSDCKNVALLSGGLDSAIIAKLSRTVDQFYTVGLYDNNEFDGARETASEIGKKVVEIGVNASELESIWKDLAIIRGEPLSLPNEGLIYKVCKSMSPEEKVVLTGEGADELLFGYDKIFRWSSSQKNVRYKEFMLRYGYSREFNAPRLEQFFYELQDNKSPIEFVEDFFLKVHLPGLLRRMDFAAMAASKEARVPFVSKSLISYLYRKPAEIKLSNSLSKIPVRKLAGRLGLNNALSRKKIGFSATLKKDVSRQKDYENFRKIIFGALKW